MISNLSIPRKLEAFLLRHAGPAVILPIYIAQVSLESSNISQIFKASLTIDTTMSLNARKIGNDAVSPIGFGLMALSAFYGAIENDEERFKVGAKFS